MTSEASPQTGESCRMPGTFFCYAFIAVTGDQKEVGIKYLPGGQDLPLATPSPNTMC